MAGRPVDTEDEAAKAVAALTRQVTGLEKAIARLEVTVSAVDTVRASLLEAAQQANDLESRTAQVLRGPSRER